MSTSEVLLYVQRLKSHFGVVRDNEVAELIGVSRQTISAWKQRGAVPLRVQKDLQERLKIHPILETDIVFVSEPALIYGAALAFICRLSRESEETNGDVDYRLLGLLFAPIVRRIDEISSRFVKPTTEGLLLAIEEDQKIREITQDFLSASEG